MPNEQEFELVGAAEIGRLLGGLSRQRVQQLVTSDTFPDPVAVLDMGKVWRANDVRDWATKHRPQR